MIEVDVGNFVIVTVVVAVVVVVIEEAPVVVLVTRSNRLTARTLTAGPHISQGESFYPGLVEEQAEAFRDGSLIAWGDEVDDGGG